VFDTPGTLRCRLAAFAATVIPLHSQLILSLPGYRQRREFVLDWFSHDTIAPVFSANCFPSSNASNCKHLTEVL
jgi:hypothetical protein